MYNRKLNIALFGLSDEVEAAFRAVEVPPRYTVEITCLDAAAIEAVRAADVVIADGEILDEHDIADLAAAVHEGIGFHELILVETPHDTDTWSDDIWQAVGDIWPAPLSPARAAFEFAHLLQRAKDHADAYIAAAYLDTLIDSMPEMVWFKALDGEHVKVNSYFCDIVDKPRDDVEGQYHNYIWSVPPEDWEKAELTCKESDEAAIAAGVTCRCEENVSTHGEIRLFDTYKTPIYDEDGSVLGTSGFAHDITVERELERLAWLNARTDYLTGLYNRRYFYEYLDEHADDGPMTFVLVDLDNFKDINDDDGHAEGDNALLVTTSALRSAFPECPVVRWGGDEFIVVVPNSRAFLAGDGNIEAFQEKLSSWTAEQCTARLTASIGIAVQGAGMSVDACVKCADDALYRAKEAGKHCHRRYEG